MIRVEYLAGSTVLLESRGVRILIDPCVKAVARVPYDVDVVLITHPHGDHWNGIRGLEASRVLAPPYTAAYLRTWGPEGVRVEPIEGPTSLDDEGELAVHPVPVEHACTDPVAYLVEDDDHRVLVTGDWCDAGTFVRELPTRDVDVVVTECRVPRRTRTSSGRPSST